MLWFKTSNNSFIQYNGQNVLIGRSKETKYYLVLLADINTGMQASLNEGFVDEGNANALANAVFEKILSYRKTISHKATPTTELDLKDTVVDIVELSESIGAKNSSLVTLTPNLKL